MKDSIKDRGGGGPEMGELMLENDNNSDKGWCAEKKFVFNVGEQTTSSKSHEIPVV